jgi:hypothetical protein
LNGSPGPTTTHTHTLTHTKTRWERWAKSGQFVGHAGDTAGRFERTFKLPTRGQEKSRQHLFTCKLRELYGFFSYPYRYMGERANLTRPSGSPKAKAPISLPCSRFKEKKKKSEMGAQRFATEGSIVDRLDPPPTNPNPTS